jgi:hypothetical protein
VFSLSLSSPPPPPPTPYGLSFLINSLFLYFSLAPSLPISFPHAIIEVSKYFILGIRGALGASKVSLNTNRPFSPLFNAGRKTREKR